MRQAAICGIVASVLTLLGMLPVALDAQREGEASSITIRVLFLTIHTGKHRKKRSTRPLLKIFLKNAYNTLCRNITRLQVDILAIRFTAAWPDPALTAAAYGAAALAMETLASLGEGRVRQLELHADVDFAGSEPALALHIRLSMRLYRVAAEAARLGESVLRDWLRDKTGKGDKS